MKQQSGFTLIELIMVIVILGILAATALPKFVDLSSDAHKAALQGVAGALTSGSNMNYAAKAVSSVVGWTTAQSGTTGCSTIAQSMVDASTSLSGYTVGGTVPNCNINLNPTITGIAAVSFVMTPTN